MQDLSTYSSQISNNPQLILEHEHLKCPRCDSNNTKFCYYNNYNLSQPRHFCKNCRRYWTKGGTLRNIPVGGGTRKTAKRPKKSSSSSSTSPSSALATTAPSSATSESEQPPKPEPSGGFSGGSFSSLLSGNGLFGNLLSMTGVGPRRMDQSGGLTEDPNSDGSGMLILNPEQPQPEFRSGNNNNLENYQLGGDSSSCWNGGNGWSGLSMYTPPGSTFQ